MDSADTFRMDAVLPLPVTHVVACPHADLITFWKPTTAKDMAYKTPYTNTGVEEKYVTFEPGTLFSSPFDVMKARFILF